MDGGRQGDKRRVGAARRRSRGHGPARLDGTRPRATVADKVMGSGKTATAATAAVGAGTTQAKRAAPPGAKADQARPGRRSCRGAKRSAAGMGWPADPLEASAARRPARAEVLDMRRSKEKAPRPQRAGAARDASVSNQLDAGGTIACNCSMTPGSTKTQAWLASIGTLNTWANTWRLMCASRPVR